ncbi:hypothetical protein Tco_0250178, partial [Tanacetum coccineum]
YEVLLGGLRITAKMKVEKIHAFVDSKLVASQVNAIIEEATRTWMTPIQEYIEHGILPEDVAEA